MLVHVSTQTCIYAYVHISYARLAARLVAINGQPSSLSFSKSVSFFSSFLMAVLHHSRPEYNQERSSKLMVEEKECILNCLSRKMVRIPSLAVQQLRKNNKK